MVWQLAARDWQYSAAEEMGVLCPALSRTTTTSCTAEPTQHGKPVRAAELGIELAGGKTLEPSQPDGWARGEREGYGGPCDVTSLSLSSAVRALLGL